MPSSRMTFVFGSGERMKDLERRVRAIARSGLPVLIEGASGTGKEALAELIHELSGVAGGMTKVICRKCGAIVYPSTGAADSVSDLEGLQPRRDGTLFLKNVHLLSANHQDQLLGTIERLQAPSNGRNVEGAQWRLLSSTTEPLEAFVCRGEMNPALYHRLSVYRISLPSLRERREDIVELMSQMMRRSGNGDCTPPPVTPQLVQALVEYAWPGNLLELENIARAYAVTGQAEEIIEELGARSRLGAVAPAAPAGLSLREQVKGASQRLEAAIILRTLEHHRWNRRRAAKSLQISYRSLLYKMKNCNLRLQAHSALEGKQDQ